MYEAFREQRMVEALQRTNGEWTREGKPIAAA